MFADVLKAISPVIIVYKPSRIGPKLQQLLLLLPRWPEGQVPAGVGGRVTIGVQTVHKRDVQVLNGRAHIVRLQPQARHVGAVVSPQNWSPTFVCCPVRPRRDLSREGFQEQPGHEGELPVAQDGGEPLELWVGRVGRAHARRAVWVLGVGGDEAGDLVPRGILEEDILEVGDQVCLGADVRLEEGKDGPLEQYVS